MLVVVVELLTGRFVATSPQDRRSPEWPPHPSRLFSALVSSWADLDAEGEGGETRAALEWLESQAPPEIVASDYTARRVLTHYVPVNDTSVLGLARTESAYEKLLVAQRGLSAATTDAKRAKALARIARARDVEAQASHVGSTNSREALEMLPAHRVRQARHYPSVSPHRPTLHYAWVDATPSPEQVEALDRVLAGVTRLGHSSSLVTCWIEDALTEFPRPVWVPDPAAGDELIRTPSKGQLQALEAAYERHQATRPRTMPTDARRYRRRDGIEAAPEPRAPLSAGEWFVYRHLGGRRLPITAAPKLAAAVRAALIRHADDPVPELISGHEAGGQPSNAPHVAVVPLPFVGSHQYADGHLLGFAVQLPRSPEHLDGRDALIRALGRWEGANAHEGYRVKVVSQGGQPVWFERQSEPIELRALQRPRWADPSTTWVTATPIALDRHPGDLGSRSPQKAIQAAERAEAAVRKACQHVGLPEPAEVSVTRAPLLVGSRPAQAFAPFWSGSNAPQRLLVHGRLVFAAPVAGPLVLGAGRYLGMGLLAPVRS